MIYIKALNLRYSLKSDSLSNKYVAGKLSELNKTRVGNSALQAIAPTT